MFQCYFALIKERYLENISTYEKTKNKYKSFSTEMLTTQITLTRVLLIYERRIHKWLDS